MDPFSITVGTVTLLEVCFRLVKYLKDFEKAIAKIDHEIQELLRDLEAVTTVTSSIKLAFGRQLDPALVQPDTERGHGRELWQNARTVLGDCQAKMEKLESLVLEIKGKESSKGLRKFDGFRKQLRKQSKDEEYNQLRRDLDHILKTLQMLLQTIELSYILESQATSDQMSETIRTLNTNIEALQPLLSSSDMMSPPLYLLRDAVGTAKAMVVLASANRHFDIPQPVSTIFTGREAQLEELKTAFLTQPPSGQNQMQKRFVIHGMGGSGKTQFVCKFAQDYRRHFWGVFWINASSTKRANQTLSRLAKQFAKREPNERAAKNWLSNLEVPWLLIIDNADDPQTRLENLFPEGERGHILITTRNPSHKVHGSVGPRFFDFGQLDGEPAIHLLLKAACSPEPWDVSTTETASYVTQALGFLPLALVFAGKAIMEGLCTLHEYVNYYRSSWQRIDQARAGSDNNSDQDLYMAVYSTYEIVYLALKDKGGEAASDAFELLNMFAFFNNEDIQVDMLIQAAKNPSLEREQEESDRLAATKFKTQPGSWTKSFEDLRAKVLAFLLQDQRPPVLPHVLRDSESRNFDIFRLRQTLRELSQLSLIIPNSANTSYSMHPLVHTWVRERPEMTTYEPKIINKRSEVIREAPEIIRAQPEMRTGRQALWCQAAATTLAQAILLPPLASQSADEDFRRDLLPHIEHVLNRQEDIRKRISRKQKLEKWLWAIQPTFGRISNRIEALELAKYSRVYSQCGLWDEAERLQLMVRDFICGVVGMEHPSAIKIQLALSGTYWAQGRATEAVDLQEKVLEACISSLGEEDHLTLKVKDTLGVSHWLQGRFKEAFTLHETAIRGLTRAVGADHEDTLRAKDNLGRIHGGYFRYQEAKELHLVAVKGMKKSKVLGPKHLDTLSAMDNLGMTYLMIGGKLLDPAQDLMDEVVKYRREKLGKEHPYTLWAICNCARVKSARGFFEEAEKDIRAGLDVAKRNLGYKHSGTLYGMTRLGQVLLHQQRYTDAEDILLDVVGKYKHVFGARDGEHKDRMMAMYFLLHSYILQGRIADAYATCSEVIEAFTTIGGQQHPLMDILLRTKEALKTPEHMDESLTKMWMVQ